MGGFNLPSPNEFSKAERLRRARELLQNRKGMNVARVSKMTGLSPDVVIQSIQQDPLSRSK